MSAPRLLVVDDEAAFGEFIVTVARENGFEAEAVTSGEDFRARYPEFNPTLVFLDLQMPNVDGIELLNVLAEQGAQVTIFIISGIDHKTLESARLFAVDRGLHISGTLQKPIRAAELSLVLSRFAANRNTR